MRNQRQDSANNDSKQNKEYTLKINENLIQDKQLSKPFNL